MARTKPPKSCVLKEKKIFYDMSNKKIGSACHGISAIRVDALVDKSLQLVRSVDWAESVFLVVRCQTRKCRINFVNMVCYFGSDT